MKETCKYGVERKDLSGLLAHRDGTLSVSVAKRKDGLYDVTTTTDNTWANLESASNLTSETLQKCQQDLAAKMAKSIDDSMLKSLQAWDSADKMWGPGHLVKKSEKYNSNYFYTWPQKPLESRPHHSKTWDETDDAHKNWQHGGSRYGKTAHQKTYPEKRYSNKEPRHTNKPPREKKNRHFFAISLSIITAVLAVVDFIMRNLPAIQERW